MPPATAASNQISSACAMEEPFPSFSNISGTCQLQPCYTHKIFYLNCPHNFLLPLTHLLSHGICSVNPNDHLAATRSISLSFRKLLIGGFAENRVPSMLQHRHVARSLYLQADSLLTALWNLEFDILCTFVKINWLL